MRPAEKEIQENRAPPGTGASPAEDVKMDESVADGLMRVDLAEVYSPPRVTAEADKMGMQAGEAMNIITGWDFNNEEQRMRAVNYIEKEKPMLLIGSPMCTAFSQLQRLNAKNAHSVTKMKEAINHMKFVTKLYGMQADAGRLFLHEHPATATS